MEERITKDEKKKLRQEEWQVKLQEEQRKKITSRILWWGGAALLLTFSVWFLVTVVNSPNNNSATITDTITVPPINTQDMTTGPKNARVVIVEYADFQCPGCGAAYPILKQLIDDYKNRILFVYRFMPLEQIHQHALLSAQASYAAYKQGKFWEMHDVLFAHQADWAEATDAQNIFVAYAKSLNLNTDQFTKDMLDANTITYIKSQEQKGIAIGIQATPTIFLNGKQIENANSYDDFKKLVDQALSK